MYTLNDENTTLKDENTKLKEENTTLKDEITALRRCGEKSLETAAEQRPVEKCVGHVSTTNVHAQCGGDESFPTLLGQRTSPANPAMVSRDRLARAVHAVVQEAEDRDEPLSMKQVRRRCEERLRLPEGALDECKDELKQMAQACLDAVQAEGTAWPEDPEPRSRDRDSRDRRDDRDRRDPRD